MKYHLSITSLEKQIAGRIWMISEPKSWSSWKGHIVRAIVLDGLYKKSEILKRTQLEEKKFEQAFNEMLQKGFLTAMGDDRFLVSSRELCKEYRNYFKELQSELVDWVNHWRLQEKVQSTLNHFFLEDKLLYEFSEKLMEHAKVEILVTNPFVERCHISTPLINMSERGINVKLVARQPSEQHKRAYLSKLIEKGVSITYDESVHAKLIVVDRCVGIVSSMNFFAASSGGGSWEAGLVTIEKEVVQSIASPILGKA